jgi:hypothetical protein
VPRTKPGSCKRCCDGVTTVPGRPDKGKCCKPNGLGCSSAAECCLGECSVGICQNTTIQLPPPSFPDEPILTVPPGVPAPPPPPACVAYGGICTHSAECCFPESGVLCNGGLCRFT